MSQDIAVGQLVAQSHKRGASSAFLAVLATDTDGKHLARNKVARALARGNDPSPDGFGAGGFYTALWEGNTARAHARADLDNRRILESASVAPARQD